VTGKVLVLPMRPGEGTVSFLLVGRFTEDGSTWATRKAFPNIKRRKILKRDRITTPPHFKIGEVMSVMQEAGGGQNAALIKVVSFRIQLTC
jgi:hypothetical protein